MKKLDSPAIERYEYNGYIIDVEERAEPDGGLLWDFWICAEQCGIKLHAVGILSSQPHMTPPRIYSKEEALDMFFCIVDDHIEYYDSQIRDIEDLNEIIERHISQKEATS